MQSKTATCGHCAEYARANFVSRGMALPGQGLPTIESGMPRPAGTGMSRRAFLSKSAGLGLTVFGAMALGPHAFDEGIAAAAAASSTTPILVSVWLSGGLDPLDLLAPVNDSTYQSLRPTLKQLPSSNPADVFTEDPSLQWHPKAAPIRDLHLAGKVTVMQGIGYGTDMMSHFVSRHYWEVGELNEQAELGWLGKYLDQYGVANNPLQGLTINSQLSPVLATASAPVSTILYPSNYWVGVKNVEDSGVYNGMFQAINALPNLTGTADDATLQGNAALSSLLGVNSTLAPIQGQAATPEGGAQYTGTDFSNRLEVLAQMLSAGMPLQVVTIQGPGGYDTHSSQTAILPGNLDDLSKSLAAFQADIEARGLADRVLVHVWSEFGRRAYENGSGTDHGAGGVGLLIGTRASGRMVGEFPGLNTLDEFGNLRTAVDYRAVYCGLLSQWFNADPTGIIPNAGQFAAPTLLKPT